MVAAGPARGRRLGGGEQALQARRAIGIELCGAAMAVGCVVAV